MPATAAATAEPLIPTAYGLSTPDEVAARERLSRINELFGLADSAAYRLQHDKLAEGRRLHNISLPTYSERRGARVRALLAEAQTLHAELGGIIAGLANLSAEG